MPKVSPLLRDAQIKCVFVQAVTMVAMEAMAAIMVAEAMAAAVTEAVMVATTVQTYD